MKLKLIRRYRGTLTDEQWLEEGSHDLPDDLAEYLVQNGHAVRIDEPLPTVTPEENSVYVRTDDNEPTAAYVEPAEENTVEPEPPKDDSKKRKRRGK